MYKLKGKLMVFTKSNRIVKVLGYSGMGTWAIAPTPYVLGWSGKILYLYNVSPFPVKRTELRELNERERLDFLLAQF